MTLALDQPIGLCSFLHRPPRYVVQSSSKTLAGFWVFNGWIEVASEGVAPDEIAAVISPELAATTFKGGTLPGANLGSFADGELTELVERLRRHEAVLSAERRVLHERIDLLQAIVVERYKSGAAHADSLLEAHNPATEEGDTEADSP